MVEILLRLLLPFTKVVMAIQRRSANLADVLRYFIYLGFEISRLAKELPMELAQHCYQAFNVRYQNIVTPICHLALFLHPKFKGAFDKLGSYKQNVLQVALQLLQKLGKGSKEKMKELVAELAAYRAGHAPYDQPWVDSMSLSAWWIAVKGCQSRVLVDMARLLAAICPHSADVERLFSMMGWYHSASRASLLSSKVSMMSKIRTAYNSDPSRAKRSKATDLPEVSLPLQLATHVPSTSKAIGREGLDSELEGLEDRVHDAFDDAHESDDEHDASDAVADALAPFYDESRAEVAQVIAEGGFVHMLTLDMEDVYPLDDPSCERLFAPSDAEFAAPTDVADDDKYEGIPVDVLAFMREMSP